MVLVAEASRYGATGEIAPASGEVLRERRRLAGRATSSPLPCGD